MTKDRACANSPTLSRRTLLTALPATGVALAMPSVARAISQRDRLDALGAEMTALVREIAPEQAGSVLVIAHEHWASSWVDGCFWGAECHGEGRLPRMSLYRKTMEWV